MDKRPVRKNLHKLSGFIFLKTIRILVGVTYDRSRSTATRTSTSNKFRLFRIFWKPNIFYTTTRAYTVHTNPGHYAVSKMSGSFRMDGAVD